MKFRAYLKKGDEILEKRNNRLLNAKLNKYIIPGIMMSLALQLGNIVDTIFMYRKLDTPMLDCRPILKLPSTGIPT